MENKYSVSVVIITSQQDMAGTNIRKKLETLGIKTHHIKEDIIHPEGIDKKFPEAEIIIFASRHKSQKPYKTLSLHPIGNWHEAKYGGRNEKIVPTNSLINKRVFQLLDEEAECQGMKKIGKSSAGYEVAMECTHHGPYINKNCFFIEVGGSEIEWNDNKAVSILANTIASFLFMKQKNLLEIDKSWVSAIALGGPHYCPGFNEIQLKSKYAIGHVIPKYALPVNKKQISEAIKKTFPKPKVAIVDIKGLGNAEVRDKTLSLLKDANLEIITTNQAKERIKEKEGVDDD